MLFDKNLNFRWPGFSLLRGQTQYGTHSKKGAETNAVMFSIVESCKLNKINPRDYFRDIVHAIHEKRSPFTPNEYLN